MAIYKKIKVWYTQVKEFLVDLPSKIKNYIVEKYNNLAVVKHYRNKRERELEVLYIDKNSEDAKRTEKKHTYEYLARNQNGKLIRGYFSALSKLDTHSYLLDEGYEVYEIKTSKMIDFLHGESQYFSVKMSQKDLIFWLTQLSTYIKSGIPLTDSVKILSQQNKKKKYKKAFDSIVYELTMGESFSEALRKQNSVFPALLINMIKAAEMIGDIEGTLDDMAIYYSELEETRKSIVSAMMYPSIILVFSIIVVAFIMIYIIPQFVDVYTSSNIELNALTQTVINISDFIRVYYIYIVLFIVGFSLIYIVMYKNIKAFRTAMQYIFMHIPVVSKIIIYKEMNLFAKTFAALNKNNILLTDSIEILSKITGNEIYKMIMYDTISNLLRGEKMSDSFKNNWAVPQIAYFMITTGESTGELSNMLEKVSDYYQKEQKNIVNIIKSFIEPLMIALLAVIVGIIILAIIIPMFGLYSAIQ
ncbi:MAG: type II secretion system F family protein [Bacilli bacterium]|nr:type II secretion system F family protein [Bacilli bacterium]